VKRKFTGCNLAPVLALAAVVATALRPPPAYVDTGSRRVPLAITSWCWGTRCGAPLGATTRTAVISRGSTVRVELKYPAVRADVRVGGKATLETSHGREVSWRATRSGGLSVYIRYAHGWVIYAGRLAVR